MTYASLKLSFILAEKRQVLSCIFLYVFSVEILRSKSETFLKKRICLDLSFCLKEKKSLCLK